MGSRLWTLLTYAHTLAGPATMLMYPLYASVIAMETTSKLDDEQWLAYWILYSFLTLLEMLLQPLLEWILIWYDVKLVFVAWLVLPQFRGAAFIYEKFVREKLFKTERLFKTNGDGAVHSTKKSPNSSKLKKLISFSSLKKGKHGATRRLSRTFGQGIESFLSVKCKILIPLVSSFLYVELDCNSNFFLCGSRVTAYWYVHYQV